MPVVRLDGFVYILTIVDDEFTYDLSDATRTRESVEVNAVLSRKRAFLETQTGNKLRVIRCDGGKELVEGEIGNGPDWAGVIIESSSPHSPEENGVAKRRNQTRTNTSITLLSQARLPQRFWPYAEYMSSIHINYIVESNTTKTLYEIIYEMKPDYSVIYPFGCHAFAHIPKASQHALDPKTRPGLYLSPSKKKFGVML